MEDRQEIGGSKLFYDPATGLPNKTLFYDRMERALTVARRDKQTLAVMFLSFDCLKLINDKLGHIHGDHLLRKIAGRINGCLRESDTVARPGRDEFMILLPDIARPEDSALVARKIFDEMNSPFHIEKHEFFVNANIGIGIFPADGYNGMDIIKHSYTALQNAKEAGKNVYKFFSQDMDDAAFKRMVAENSLRLALKREEFFLNYQPQVDLKTGSISGMEALVRWRCPGSGVVYPNDFIRLAEESGLIVPLGEWVLRKACEQNKLWQKAGMPPLRVAVNISARQFHHQDLADLVTRVLEETDLDPRFLDLELTESTFMKDVESAMETLHSFKEIGIQTSIDDFGTGYSSLCYLKYFPVTRLKVVEPFISCASADASDKIIAKAIVDMAHGLNMKVIAEGVEKREDMDFVRSLSFDELQGNIFSRPLPAEQMTQYFSRAAFF